MLESARRKFLDPDPAVRLEALEKIWDAFERVKTLEIPGDGNKKVSATNSSTKLRESQDSCRSYMRKLYN